MSQTDRWMETQETMHQAATEVAIRAGLLGRCTDCNGVYDPLTNDVEAAYRLGNSLITKGDDEVAVFDGDRLALTDRLKNITADYGEDCECRAALNRYMEKD